MTENVKILTVGTKILTVIGKINAFITGVSVRENNTISYEVSYFVNGSYTTCWLNRFEFEVNESITKIPGFNQTDVSHQLNK